LELPSSTIKHTKKELQRALLCADWHKLYFKAKERRKGRGRLSSSAE